MDLRRPASSKRTYNQNNINSLEEISLIAIVKQFLEKANNFIESDDENLKNHYEPVRLYLKRTCKVPWAISILEKLIVGLNESYQNRRYWFWQLFESYETTELILPEIFDSSAWSYKVKYGMDQIPIFDDFTNHSHCKTLMKNSFHSSEI